jgi:malate dehydrogenase
MLKKTKISIIGSGKVGENVAYYTAIFGLGDIYIFGREKEGIHKAKGIAYDINEMVYLLGHDIKVDGISYNTEGWEKLKDSDIVVITAGIPRKPGMSREDLLKVNLQLIKYFSEQIKKYSPQAVVIVVSNPVDVLTYMTLKYTEFDKRKVMGMAGVLDTARMKEVLYKKAKEELNSVSIKDIRALVLGTHGDTMVPVLSKTFIGNTNIRFLFGKKDIEDIIEKTKKGGGIIVSYMGTSAYSAPSASVVVMMESIIKDLHRILPASVYVEGEIADWFGFEDVCIGLPVMLGKNGIEDYELVTLNARELRSLQKSAAHVKKLIELAKKLENN